MASFSRERRISGSQVRACAFNFLLNAIGLIHVLVFQVQHWIDPMLARQWPVAVFPSPACKDGAITRSRLPLKVKFGGPARRDAIFQLHVWSEIKLLTGARQTRGAGHFNLQVARFFHVMGIGNEEGALLRGRDSR